MHLLTRIQCSGLTSLLLLGLLAASITPTLGADKADATPAKPANTLTISTSWGDRIRKGGNTAIVQFAVSIFGTGFIFGCLFNLRRKNLAPEGLADRARGLWKAGKFDELEKLGETDPSTLARIISFIAKNRRSPMLEVSEVCG